jgi:hypothetical protein
MENMKKKYEIVNANWIRVFSKSLAFSSDIFVKLNSVTSLHVDFLDAEYSPPRFRISFCSVQTQGTIEYLETEEQEFKRDLALFEGMLTKL